MRRSDAPTSLLTLLHGVTDSRLAQLPDWIQRGEIGDAMRLVVGRLIFEPGSYRISEWLNLPDPLTMTEPASVGDHGSHTHAVPRPPELRPLEVGDQVVVGLYLEGVEPVVMFRDVGT